MFAPMPGINWSWFKEVELVQRGENPDDYRPMPAVGPGTAEIRSEFTLLKSTGYFMWRDLMKRSLFCTASTRRLRQPGNQT